MAMNTAVGTKKDEKQSVHHVEIHKAENGHTVEAHFTNPGNEWKKPEVHVFGSDQGGDALAKAGELMGIKNAAEEKGEPEHKGGAKVAIKEG